MAQARRIVNTDLCIFMKKKQKNHHHFDFSGSASPAEQPSELMLPPGMVYSSPVMEQLQCVMLAAGSSTRMDTWKMMLPWGPSTIIEHAVRTALEVCSRLILVVGFRAQELIDVFGNWPRVEVVINPDFRAGMFSSVQRGVQAVTEGGFFLALADMPGVSGRIYGDLLEWSRGMEQGFADKESPYAVIPQYGGKKGHPLLLSAEMRTLILQTDVSKTLRDVLARVPTMIVPVDEPRVLHDIDTPEDYRSRGPEQDSAGDSH
jgi:molybdenum cofactor cytidylyltransferase